ncbi:phosphatidate cytidylyltransferase [[Mycoplasma] gypis]|uniref:Phosphatidate cytidylyltransferase n=1 Tax=[Mycoplasma] gypis TaxID=92404 RepID=A0ABZ2RVU0_9BACT|nr:phosphatidate cytidylyltransferase [[Mycoplasma] gypis]MBN0919477.1 phosphatidate cytidylyltransferase [[Mycoplasma] gypis]
MKNLLKRSISATILFVVLIPFIFITYYGLFPGRIIGFCFYFLFTLWASFEIIKHLNWNPFSKVFALFGIGLSFLMPIDQQLRYMFVTTSDLPHTISLAGDSLANAIKLYAFSPTINSLSMINWVASVICLIVAAILSYKHLVWKELLIAITVTIIIPLFTKILFIINIYNIYILLAIELIAISVDTSAMLGGMALGQKFIKRKFAPRISPKKTWEGAIISVLFGMIVVFLATSLSNWTNNSYTTIFSSNLAIVTAVIFLPIVTILGDLLYSLFKRVLKIKDFSNLIPGHGGIMDRFDSVSVLTIVFSLIYVYAN